MQSKGNTGFPFTLGFRLMYIAYIVIHLESMVFLEWEGWTGRDSYHISFLH